MCGTGSMMKCQNMHLLCNWLLFSVTIEPSPHKLSITYRTEIYVTNLNINIQLVCFPQTFSYIKDGAVV